MPERSLGVVWPNGTRKRATVNESDPTLPVRCSSYRVQHWPGNTGTGYVGGTEMEFSSGQDVYGYILPPSDPSSEPYEPTDDTADSYPHDMKNIYIDAENDTDKFLVTIMV
mgnify:CR=1 FL=1